VEPWRIFSPVLADTQQNKKGGSGSASKFRKHLHLITQKVTDPKRGFTCFFLHVSNAVYVHYLGLFQKFGHMGERGGSPKNYIHGAGRKSRLCIHEVTKNPNNFPDFLVRSVDIWVWLCLA
jgi:hypothetical protein